MAWVILMSECQMEQALNVVATCCISVDLMSPHFVSNGKLLHNFCYCTDER